MMLSKSDRPENSVLFSLKELRRLENERVKAEAEARMAQAEAERRARAEAEARARDEELRRVRAEEERRQRAESEREARQREDRLRLEEAERRARVEGELRLREQQLLEEQRQRHAHGRRFGRSAWTAVAAAVALCVTVGGGMAAWASRQHQAEKKALEREIEQARAAQLQFDAKIHALEEKARRDADEAKTASERARILRDLERQKRDLEVVRPRPPRRTAPPAQPIAGPTKPRLGVPQKPEINDDPLGNLPAGKSGAF
jgi:colicin import membrane protein